MPETNETTPDENRLFEALEALGVEDKIREAMNPDKVNVDQMVRGSKRVIAGGLDLADAFLGEDTMLDSVVDFVRGT
ncbi:MAG: hypothetical protein ABEN55_12045 [Bradymonadaceae bacterium]